MMPNLFNPLTGFSAGWLVGWRIDLLVMEIGDSPSFLPQLISFSGLFNTHFNHKFVFFLPTLHKIDLRNSSYLSFSHKKWKEKNTEE